MRRAARRVTTSAAGDGLLGATVAEVIDDVATSLTSPDPSLTAHQRIESYVTRLVHQP